jgi:hypothetical protein
MPHEFSGRSAVNSIQASPSDHKRIQEILVQLQRNRNKKQFIELGLTSLVWIWVTFPLPTILISYNNAIKARFDWGSIEGSHTDPI